jgi:translocation protein SEC66
MANNFVIRKRVDEVQSQLNAEKEWWEKRKATIQTEFMKELDEDAQKSALASPTSVTSSAGATAKSGTSGAGSEDDTVLVDSGVPKDQQGGGKKKKKGKN